MLISCNTSRDEYAGETGTPRCVSIKEHVDGKRKTRQSTRLGAYGLQKHNGDNGGVKVVILAHNFKISTRINLEALVINVKNLIMNRSAECLEVILGFNPYLKRILDAQIARDMR